MTKTITSPCKYLNTLSNETTENRYAFHMVWDKIFSLKKKKKETKQNPKQQQKTQQTITCSPPPPPPLFFTAVQLFSKCSIAFGFQMDLNAVLPFSHNN